MAEQKQITPAEFKVDVEQLGEAIQIVGGRRDDIRLKVEAIDSAFKAAEGYWRSPAGSSFATFQAEFDRTMQSLDELLDEMVRRMTAAHDQYVEIEQVNTANFDKHP
ncbi:WXG100 family type VII secretion target [Kitasatospora sp. NPDC058965]|uniref:WXG100 family type VII secretion target n=1 Tax=Kitasatospora sp. NPDC058965 TaxID=3346682 RepID=UPI00367C2AA6